MLAVLTFMFALPASAVLLGKDGFYYEFDNNGNAVLSEYHSSNNEVNIPAEIYNHPVVRINNYVFLEIQVLQQLLFRSPLPKSITVHSMAVQILIVSQFQTASHLLETVCLQAAIISKLFVTAAPKHKNMLFRIISPIV